MIIDAHTHVGFDGVIPDASVERLVAALRKADTDKALVFAGRINGCPTERLVEALKPHQGMLYPVGSVSPLEAEKPNLKTVEVWLRDGLIHGLKFYSGYEYFHPFDEVLRPYLHLLAKYGKPAIFHSGDTYSKADKAKLKYALPIHVDDLATEMPELKIVIAHMGYPWVTDAAEVCYKNANVYSDCSGFVYGKFDAPQRRHFIELFKEFMRVVRTPDKLLYGSDWPVAEPSSYVPVVKALAGKNARKIFSENAMRVYGIE